MTIPLTVTLQDGASAADYSGVPTTVEFTTGVKEATFSFTATDDTVDDDGESVKLAFGTLPARVTADTAQGVATQTVVSINDNDLPEITVSYQSATLSVAEGSTINVQVTLSAAPERDVTIGIVSSVQDDASSADYTVAASVSFTANQTVKTFAFTATSDTVDDDGAKVKLTFASSLPTRITEGTTKETIVSITDDDPTVTVNFDSPTYTVAEGSSVAVKLTLSADPEREVTIPFTKTDQGGATSADYTAADSSVIFTSGETEKSVTFSATQDTVDDDGESVKYTLGAMPSQITEGTTDETVVSITDDDPPVTVQFGSATYTVAEGASVTVTVTLSADPERTVTIPLSVDITNTSGSDYSGIPASVTFDAGETSKSFSVAATQDTVDDDGESIKLTFGAKPDRVTEGTIK